ncbi:prepilin-type N-terminal cleavage/methylation domain-containing protein, partial [Staphylococcus aureus]
MKKEKGFTLTEAMIVLAILGILASILVDTKSSWDESKFQEAQEKQMLERKDHGGTR